MSQADADALIARFGDGAYYETRKGHKDVLRSMATGRAGIGRASSSKLQRELRSDGQEQIGEHDRASPARPASPCGRRYLGADTLEMAWREDHHPISNGEQVHMISGLAMKRGRPWISADIGRAARALDLFRHDSALFIRRAVLE